MADPIETDVAREGRKQEQKVDARTKLLNAKTLRELAETGLTEVKTAEACATTAANAQASNLQMKLPKVCDKYLPPKPPTPPWGTPK